VPPPHSTPEPPPADAFGGLSPSEDVSSLPVCNWPDPNAPPQPFHLNVPCLPDPKGPGPNLLSLPDGTFFPLPPGATLHTVVVSLPGDGYSGPHGFQMVRLGNSWIKFTEKGIFDSHIEVEDAGALRPVVEQLSRP